MKYYNYYFFNKYLILFLVLYSLGCLKTHSQELDSLKIWSKDYKLCWDDFLGNSPLTMKRGAALSFLEIHNITTYHKNEVLYYTVIPVFNRNKSATLYFTDVLLEHEQLHFDIQELFARKIRKEFQLLDENNACNISYQDVFNNQSEILRSYQKRFDFATGYSLKLKKQQIWKNKISKELKILENIVLKICMG